MVDCPSVWNDAAFTPSGLMLWRRRTCACDAPAPQIHKGTAAMTIRPVSRIAPLAIGLAVLAACSDHNTRGTTTSTRTVESTSTTRAASGHAESTRSSSTAATSTSTRTTKTKEAPLPDSTGIAACDEYLASYKSCHLAAGVFPRDQIDNRYDMMRTSLLRQSQDPDMRDQLGARCTSLASQLKDVLKGKSCADVPAPASTSP